MDRNTVTGFVLIGLLLVGFGYFTRPDAEQMAAIQQQNDSIAAIQANQDVLEKKQAEALAQDVAAPAVIDSTSLFFQASKGAEELITLENDLRSSEAVILKSLLVVNGSL